MLRWTYHRSRELADRLRPARLYSDFRWAAHRLGLLGLYWRIKAFVAACLRPFGPRRLWNTQRWLRQLVADLRRRRREERLTVAVDISAFWEPLTGIGWYLFRLLEHMAARDDLRLRLYSPSLIDTPDFPPPTVELPDGPALEVVRYPVPTRISLPYVWTVGFMRRRQARLIAADRNDLLFAPNYFLPEWFGAADGRLVATVHDLGFQRVPETLREKTRLDLARHLERTLGRATKVLTDSRTVREELLAEALIDEDRVHAVHLGPGLASTHGEEPSERASRADLPQGTPERYVLHVGTLEPRKNLGTLLAAWRRLEQGAVVSGKEVPSLVLCGGLGWGAESFSEALDAGRREGWLVHFGYLPEAQVAALYRRALLVVLPSIYEGFGLPAVEAMHSGVPLVCSDIPVLREVAGEAARYVPAEDVAAWATAVTRLLEDDGERAALVAAGRRRRPLFAWPRTAEETVAVWVAASGSPAVPRGGHP